MIIKNKHAGSVIDSYQSVIKQIKYHEKNTLPFYSEMENWERKEYEQVHKSNLEIAENLKNQLIKNEIIFNELLAEYGLTVETFIETVNSEPSRASLFLFTSGCKIPEVFN